MTTSPTFRRSPGFNLRAGVAAHPRSPTNLGAEVLNLEPFVLLGELRNNLDAGTTT